MKVAACNPCQVAQNKHPHVVANKPHVAPVLNNAPKGNKLNKLA